MATSMSEEAQQATSMSEEAQQAATSMGKSTLEILVIGKTGVGKSALINALVGYEVSPESSIEVGTFKVETIPTEMYGGVKAIFYDSPGLHDGKGQEKEYMQQIVDVSDNLDLVLFCTKLTDNRVTQEDCDTICEFTQVLGERFWENAVFVLTFANNVRPKTGLNDPEKKKKAMTDKLKLMTKKLQEVLRSKAKVKTQIVKKIPFVPTGYYTPELQYLPDGSHWFSNFWISCFVKVKEDGKPAIIQGCLDLFKTENEKRAQQEQLSPAYEPQSAAVSYPMPQMSPSIEPPPAYYQDGFQKRQIPMAIQLPNDTPTYKTIMQLLSWGVGHLGLPGKVISCMMDIGVGVVDLFRVFDFDEDDDKS
ncbi:uncharacterized protein LOC135337748 [Halichondria panicea]|uniref:uncharacterized protein LOC135337748 n=1 Tax=Halichondria panicea TaxID=6063 RepID=UPI00312B7A11